MVRVGAGLNPHWMNVQCLVSGRKDVIEELQSIFSAVGLVLFTTVAQAMKHFENEYDSDSDEEAEALKQLYA